MDGLSRQDAVEWLKSLEMMATFILERITEAPPQPQLPSSQYSSFDGVSLYLTCITSEYSRIGQYLKKQPSRRVL